MGTNFADKVEIANVTEIRESERALLVRIDGHEHWIPKSHVHDDSECYKEGDTGTIVVSSWIAKERGLE